MNIIELQRVSKSFGPIKALEQINLSLESGRIIGLLGTNGSGKSTMIKLINDLLVPDQGIVKVNGQKPGIETKKIVSYLPERSYLDPNMKVVEILRYFQDFYKDFDIQKAQDLLKEFTIPVDRRIKTLSKGTREKLQLILVMSRKAKLYILDEPMAGVDPAARDHILDTILSGYDEGSTILISTHLIADVEECWMRLSSWITVILLAMNRRNRCGCVKENRLIRFSGGFQMLGLCLKYDLKALFRVTWPVYVVSMVLPIGIQIFYWIQDWPIFDTMIFQMFSGFYTIIYIMSLFCLIIWPIVVCVRHFFNSMLKDEGYLTNTLPVSRNTLIISKEMAGLALFLISFVLFILSILIVIPTFDFMELKVLLTSFHWTFRNVDLTCIIDFSIVSFGLWIDYDVCLGDDVRADASQRKRNIKCCLLFFDQLWSAGYSLCVYDGIWLGGRYRNRMAPGKLFCDICYTS